MSINHQFSHASESCSLEIKKRNNQSKAENEHVYNTKIIKAGALLGDTKVLFSHWNLELSVDENLGRIKRENLLGKLSRSRVEDVLAIFRQRYLTENEVISALVRLVKNGCDGNVLDRILYFHAVRADALLRDVVLELLASQWLRGSLDIEASVIQMALKRWVNEGRSLTKWGEYTIGRVARGVLSTLRDFGVLKGMVNKRISPPYLPLRAFVYIAFYLKQKHLSGIKLVELDDWKFFFLPREGVDRFLAEAHQEGLLEYHSAGSVIRLTFPVSTLEEYADVISQNKN